MTNAHHSQAEADWHLRRILGEVDNLMQAWDGAAATPPVQPGSLLAQDDALTHPWQLSHIVTEMLTVAVEQLHAIKTLMLDAGMLHNHAPFTLARSAIEVSGTALWMLQPESQRIRVRRRLTCAAQDAKDANEVAHRGDRPPSVPLSDRLSRMRDLVAAVERKPVESLPWLKISKVMEQVDALSVSPIGVLDAWRTASGFAHGRQWAALGVLRREVRPGPEAGTVNLRLTNEVDSVLWVVWPAWDLIQEVRRLFEHRANTVPPRARSG